jgi:predicted nucleotide-binding protein
VQKARVFRHVKFDAKTISNATDILANGGNVKPVYRSLDVNMEDDEWSFETLAEFLAAVDQGSGYFMTAYIDKTQTSLIAQYYRFAAYTKVTVSAPNRAEIERIFSVFDKETERCQVPEAPDDEDDEPDVKVFIGHGRNPQWRDLKDHLHEKHGYLIEAYEIGSRAGHSIRDVLEDMLDESSFALLVMTGEDEDKDGKLHARENVIHETGLFQGSLGFSRAIVLLEAGTQEFSNLAGIQQIRYAKGNIKETFGEVLAVLKRELG